MRQDAFKATPTLLENAWLAARIASSAIAPVPLIAIQANAPEAMVTAGLAVEHAHLTAKAAALRVPTIATKAAAKSLVTQMIETFALLAARPAQPAVFLDQADVTDVTMVILLIARNLARDARRTVASAGMALCKGARIVIVDTASTKIDIA
ncbi:unnamed protein product [Effrenium voratum]|uniref:Uncharacterized protein n=1 Tax=Effrenium voratum TaxID=2562239 RepID=A0AA36JHH0_9DINO|nr:unnamed protein product [Effrenium voratum]